MTEEWLRRELAEAVEDEPPLWLDVDDVVATGQRRAARRRALIGAAAATAALAVLATTVSLLVSPGGAPPPAAGSTAATSGTSSPATPWPGRLTEPSKLTRADYQAIADPLRRRVAAAAVERLTGDEPIRVSPNAGHFRPGSSEQSWQFTIEPLKATNSTPLAVVNISASDAASVPNACDALENGTREPGDVPHTCDQANNSPSTRGEISYLWFVAPSAVYRTVTVSVTGPAEPHHLLVEQLQEFSRAILS